MAKLAILCPGYPGRLGGVADHTRRLVRSWEQAGHEVDVVGDVSSPPAIEARRLAEDGTAAALIQYVPFLYGRRGLSTWPARFALASRRRSIRTVVFVHEPWVPPSRLPWLILSPLQRSQLRRLCRLADATVTPVPAWAAMLNAGLVRVSATLTEPPSDDHPRVETPLVFSPFAAGLQWDWIAAAAQRIGSDPPLTIIGATEEEARLSPAVAPYVDRRWRWLGYLSPGRVAGVLGEARLVLAPFIDGLTARRTSAMAALAAGAPTLSNTGPLFDDIFRDSPVILAESQEEFVANAWRLWQEQDDLMARSARLRWFDRTLSPAMLDRELVDLMLAV